MKRARTNAHGISTVGDTVELVSDEKRLISFGLGTASFSTKLRPSPSSLSSSSSSSRSSLILVQLPKDVTHAMMSYLRLHELAPLLTLSHTYSTFLRRHMHDMPAVSIRGAPIASVSLLFPNRVRRLVMSDVPKHISDNEERYISHEPLAIIAACGPTVEHITIKHGNLAPEQVDGLFAMGMLQFSIQSPFSHPSFTLCCPIQ
jgi:hypothetical protein